MAYVLMCALRRIGLAHSQFADATGGTIRLKLLKIGALVRASVRRIKVAMSSACPWQNEFALAHVRLRHAATNTNQTSQSQHTSQKHFQTGGVAHARPNPRHRPPLAPSCHTDTCRRTRRALPFAGMRIPG
jgi:hypothetical protein